MPTNELVFLNRILMFSLNPAGTGELHNAAQGVQMWCMMQVLIGKLFETWIMLRERFLKANPEDPALTALAPSHKESLEWLRNYFGEDPLKDSALRMIRDKTAFHYDKLNLETAMETTGSEEHRVFLAEHPANSLYYVGSALIFETVFGMAEINLRMGVLSGIARSLYFCSCAGVKELPFVRYARHC